jgi:hypothetical protein
MALRLLYAALIGLIIFIGCGGGGGGGTGLSPLGPALVNGRISGTLEIDQTIASVRGSDNSLRSGQRFLDSMVMIEELPNYSTRADANGQFVFDNLPLGSYRVIARITSLSGRQYKMRTGPFTVTEKDKQKEARIVFSASDVAETQLRIIAKDLNGVAVGKCRIWFWGEQFTMDEGGYYLSPMMPSGAEGQLKIEPPAERGLSGLDFFMPASFFSAGSLTVTGVIFQRRHRQ